MKGKILITVVAGVVVAALMALGWWWFFNRPQPVPNQTGTFGSSGNKTGGNTSPTTPTNVGNPVIGSNSGSGGNATGGQKSYSTIPAGTYPLTNSGGQLMGNYEVAQDAGGNYTFTPVNGAGDLVTGTYTVGSVGTYDINQNGSDYSVNPVTYGTGTGTGGTGSGTGGTGSGTGTGTGTGSGTGSGTGTGGGTGTSGAPTDLGLGSVDTSGADWLASSGGGTIFNPTPINGVHSANPSGGVLPNLGGGSGGSSGGGGLGLGGALAGAVVGGAVSCAGLLIVGVLGSITATAPYSVQTNPGITNGKNVLDCIARGIAKAAIQQITVSVVNWINSGFSGSPSFVTNPTQFFTNVADTAAGQYIKGSALSFLCSPFQLQIRIAVAQSYANQGAQQCSLTGVINNVNSFMNGNFSAGGWGGFLAFTTIPTNNPYGAYAYGSIGIQSAVTGALKQKQDQLNQGRGFLTFQKQQNCHIQATPPTGTNPNQVTTTIGSGNGAIVFGGGVGTANKQSVNAQTNTTFDSFSNTQYEVCDLVDTTPGSVIAGAIDTQMKLPTDSLNLAKSFDEIINALITQLVTRVLQGGLSNVSGQGGYASTYYTPDQLAAQSASQGLTNQLQSDVSVAQQYGAVEQGSISDIQSTQAQVNDLYNCWTNAAIAASANPITVTSGSTTVDAAAQAMQNAAAASTTLASLQAQVTNYNTAITTANNSISILENFESQALSAGSGADVSALSSAYDSAHAQGQIFSSADLTTAQQNRTTLQAQLAAINAQTATGLQQCNAF